MVKFIPKKGRCIGLDIGSSSMKSAEIVHQNGRLVPLKVKLQEIDSHKDKQDGQLDALESLFRDIDTQNARINVVINCANSCTKILLIPFMPKSEIPQALEWEMKDSISFPIDQAVLDYKILKEIVEGGIKKLKVAVACCPRETINKQIALLRGAGIEPALFTQHGFALKNVIGNLCPEDNKTVALLDIGCNLSELLIFHNGELAFSRKLPVAGQDFARDMTQSLVSASGKMELTLAEAESIKKKYGIVDYDDVGTLDDKIAPEQLVSLLRPNVEKLAVEIERSFAFYREREHGSAVELLLLLGGGGALKNLAGKLSESLGISVQLGYPLATFPTNGSTLLSDEPETAHCYLSALGAALASPSDINLLPVDITQQTKLLVRRSSIEALATAAAVILVLVYAGMRIKLAAYDKRIAAAELEFGALSPQVEEMPKQVFLGGVRSQRVYWSDALKEISNLIPEPVRLIEINAEEDRLTLRGEIKSPGTASEQVLTEFMRSLEKGILREVDLISTKNLPLNALTTFELRAGVE